MDSISLQLDRMRETQLNIQSAVVTHGDLLHELVNLQREAVKLQMEMARKTIAPDRESSRPATLPASSKPTAKDVIQWVAAITMIAWVLRGGSPEALLKALAALSGG